MCATLYRVDVVYKRVYILVVRAIVCESHFDGDSLSLGIEMYYVVDERLFVGVDILYKLTQTLFGVKYLTTGVAFCVELTHIGESQCDARVEICKVAEAYREGVVVIFSDCKYRAVRLKGYGRACGLAFADHLELGSGFAA